MTTTTPPPVTRLAALTAKSLTTWKASSSSHLPVLNLPVDSSGCVAWSADARFLATPVNGNTAVVAIRECDSGKVVEVVPSSILENPSSHRVATLAFGTRRNSRFLYLACGRQVLVWDRKERKVCLKFSGHTVDVTAVALNVDETNLASGGVNGEMKIHSLKTNTTSSLASPLTQSINKCAFSPFKKSTIAAVGDDGAVVVWDFNVSAQPMFVVKDAHMAPIHGLAWSPCNKSLFATAGLDRKVLVYNKDENGKILLRFETDSPVTSLSVNDDFLIAAGSLSGKVTLFDVRTRKSSYYFHTNSAGEVVSALEFEPPQWAQETSQRDQGGINSGSKGMVGEKHAMVKQVAPRGLGMTKQQTTSSTQPPPPAPGSGSPVVAALKERMAAVKEKQTGLMDLFSPVKPSFRQESALMVETKGIPTNASSHLREVVTASTDAEEETSEDVQVTPILLGRAKKDVSESNTLDLFSPLGGAIHGRVMSSSPPSNQFHTPTNDSDPFFATKSNNMATSMSTTASDPIARLQNALNQLKSKTPVKSTTPEDTNGRNSPVSASTTNNSNNASSAGLNSNPYYPNKPMSPVMGINASQENSLFVKRQQHSQRKSSESTTDIASGTATALPFPSSSSLSSSNEKQALTLKNLPGSPGHVAVAMPVPSLYREVLEQPTKPSQPEEQNGVEDDEEDDDDNDVDIWMTKEVLESDAASVGWTSSFGGGLVGDEFLPPKSFDNLKSTTVGIFSRVANEEGGIDVNEEMEGQGTAGVGATTTTTSTTADADAAVGGYAHKVLEAALESCLEDFRKQVKEEIQNMHVELLRQFYIQKNEISQLFEEHSPSESLLKEVVRLREENARLRCGFK
ncbi:WD40-repeat-containing domain protein [Obelidium mucronatum]|nr:WD40-repeat-containing domain protein [Obelidium mucronatum]